MIDRMRNFAKNIFQRFILKFRLKLKTITALQLAVMRRIAREFAKQNPTQHVSFFEIRPHFDFDSFSTLF